MIENEQWFEFMHELSDIRKSLVGIETAQRRLADAADQRNEFHAQFNRESAENQEKILAAQSDAIERGFAALGRELNADAAADAVAAMLDHARTAPPEPSPVRITHLPDGGFMENIG